MERKMTDGCKACDGDTVVSQNNVWCIPVFVLVLGILLVDTMVYGLAVPFFPHVLHGRMDDKVWMRWQSAGNFIAAIAGLLVGWFSDNVGRARLLVLSQFWSLACMMLLWVGVVHENWVPAHILVLGFVLRKANRTYPLCQSIITDITEDKSLRKDRLDRLGSMFGFGFAFGPALVGQLSHFFDAGNLFALGLILVVLNIFFVIRCLPSSEAAAGVHEAEPHTVTWATVVERCTHPLLLAVLTLHFLAAFSQFVYITTIGLAARDVFDMDTATFGSLVSWFGVTFSFSLMVIVPWIRSKVSSEKNILTIGFAVTAVTRFLASMTRSVSFLFVVHFFVSVGTATISSVATSIVTRIGRSVGLVGSLIGVQDSLQRIAGVLAPLAVNVLTPFVETHPAIHSLESYLGHKIYVGGFLSGFFYAVACVGCILFVREKKEKDKDD